MLVPAAASSAPIAVLVLAWDEATPAVRALVAATQASTPAIDSILVMVPQADAPDHLSAEEYLPVSLPAPAGPAAPAPAVPATEPLPAPPPIIATITPALKRVLAEALEEDCEPAAVGLLLPKPAPPQPVALVWSAVRVLRLGSLSLPQVAQRAGQPLPAPTWIGNATVPAAPYQGASDVASGLDPDIIINKSISYEHSEISQEIPGKPRPFTTPLVTTQQLAQPAATIATTGLLYESAEPIVQAPDLEADLQPDATPELPAAELLATDPVIAEAAALAPSTPPEQAGWPEALAALRQPAPEPAAALSVASEAAGALPTYPALRPAAAHYPAPDLNFKIIQYARFAVPVALAEPAFAAIYAPAWPTWLAAQELRQRTGRPLVLHVATLAAPATESVETATGWIAELQRQALHRADLILAETPALAQRLRHDLGLPASVVQAVPATDTEAIVRALHGAQQRPLANLT